MTNNNLVSKIPLTLLIMPFFHSICYGENNLMIDTDQLPSIHSRQNQFTTPKLGLNEVLEYTKYHQPDIQLKAQEIAYAQGELQVESGVYDPEITVELNHGTDKEIYFDTDEDDNPINFEYDESFFDFEMDVTKQFRSGQTATVGFLVDYEDIEDSGTGATSESEAYIQLIQPLLKNRGGGLTQAQEAAAEQVVDARKLELRDSVSTSLLNTTEEYWNYLEALKILEIRREAAYPIEDLVSNLTSMKNFQDNIIETEEAEAELYLRQAYLIEAKQEYLNAKHQLGLAMGIASYKDINNLPEPGDEFIKYSISDLNTIRASVPVYLRRAEHQRGSILSLKRLQESTILLLNATKREKEPQLDLVAKYGYLGTEDESSISQGFRVVNKNADATWLVGGLFSYQLGNNTAKGEFAQQKALLSELNLELNNSLREISSNIIVQVEELVNISKEADLTSKSINLYRKSLIRQKKDLLGDPDLGVLLDFINTQNELIDVKIEQIEQKSRYSRAIANLVYETGQILETGTGFDINVGSLTSIP